MDAVMQKCLNTAQEFESFICIVPARIKIVSRHIYYQLLKYVRKHFEETITSVGILPMVYFNYARVLDLCGRYEDSAECAEEGRKACLKYGHYQYLPHCLEIQAECAHFMGDDKKSADLYRKCYYLCQVIEYQEGLEITKKEAKEYLGMEFET